MNEVGLASVHVYNQLSIQEHDDPQHSCHTCSYRCLRVHKVRIEMKVFHCQWVHFQKVHIGQASSYPLTPPTFISM